MAENIASRDCKRMRPCPLPRSAIESDWRSLEWFRAPRIMKSQRPRRIPE
jgi:hypothetical protein